MNIYDYVDQYIENFVDDLRKNGGEILKSEIYERFTERYPTFTCGIFDRKGLENYLISEVGYYSGVKVIGDGE